MRIVTRLAPTACSALVLLAGGCADKAHVAGDANTRPAPSPPGMSRSSAAPTNLNSTAPTDLTPEQALDRYLPQLPDRSLITSARFVDTPPREAEASGSGPWLALTSDAVADLDQFRVHWESELLTAAVWRATGSDNSVVSGGGVTFASRDSAGASNDEHYAFADDSDTYLFTLADGSPSSLVVPREQVTRWIDTAAQQMHIHVTSIDFFDLQGTNVLVTATSDSGELHPNGASPFGPDEDMLEGSALIVTDPSGRTVLAMDHSTGLESGDGGGFGDAMTGGLGDETTPAPGS